MRKAPGRALLVLLALLLPALGLAQGLGDLAARERQKRQVRGPAEAPRVLTNDDLPERDPGKASSAPASAASSSEASSETDRRNPDEREGGPPAASAVAQAEADAARAAVVAAEARLKELQDKLNPMSPSFIYGVTQTGDAVGEEMRTRDELRQAEGELAAARAALVQANQALEDARQAARRALPE